MIEREGQRAKTTTLRARSDMPYWLSVRFKCRPLLVASIAPIRSSNSGTEVVVKSVLRKRSFATPHHILYSLQYFFL